jgi:phosphatidylglycerol:prolipoprotein diacylglycerol transferase
MQPFISFDQLGIHIASLLYIRYYGILLMVGALAGAFLVEYLARRRGLNSDLVWDGFIWVLLGGVLGARIWHILTPTAADVSQGITTYYYLTHPFQALAVWEGGLGWPGAVIGGGLALFGFVRSTRLSFGVWADLAAPGIALGQAIGRWGNFINHELYGKPSTLPWAIYIPPENRLQGYYNVSYYHPLFAYESILNLINMGLLLFLGEKYRDRLKAGDLILLYFVNYGLIRFFLEFLRLDTPETYGFDINQVVAGGAVIVAGAWLLWRHGLSQWWLRRRNPEAALLAEAAAAPAAAAPSRLRKLKSAVAPVEPEETEPVKRRKPAPKGAKPKAKPKSKPARRTHSARSK